MKKAPHKTKEVCSFQKNREQFAVFQYIKMILQKKSILDLGYTAGEFVLLMRPGIELPAKTGIFTHYVKKKVYVANPEKETKKSNQKTNIDSRLRKALNVVFGSRNSENDSVSFPVSNTADSKQINRIDFLPDFRLSCVIGQRTPQPGVGFYPSVKSISRPL